METIKFLNDYLSNSDLDTLVALDALQYLKDELGIKFSLFEEYNLIVLNYDQIESAKFKTHPIVCECRSLVITFDQGVFEVVSRSFDRFFNHGEVEIGESCVQLTAYEKLDGSLIGIFYWEGEWLFRTKSMIMPVGEINGLDVTWDSLVLPLIDFDYMNECIRFDDEFVNQTFICELVGPANRVVVRYQEPALRLLSIRNKDGEYCDFTYEDMFASGMGWDRPIREHFSSFEEAMEAAKNLPNLEEGYVFYDEEHNKPVLKLKNPAYVVAHHLRGEGVLNDKRVCDLIIMGEIDEYLSVFPEDDQLIAPYVKGFKDLKYCVRVQWSLAKDIVSQKEFAMEVKDSPTASLLFSMRKGLSFEEAWSKLTQNAKRQMILKFK